MNQDAKVLSCQDMVWILPASGKWHTLTCSKKALQNLEVKEICQDLDKLMALKLAFKQIYRKLLDGDCDFNKRLT